MVIIISKFESTAFKDISVFVRHDFNHNWDDFKSLLSVDQLFDGFDSELPGGRKHQVQASRNKNFAGLCTYASVYLDDCCHKLENGHPNGVFVRHWCWGGVINHSRIQHQHWYEFHDPILDWVIGHQLPPGLLLDKHDQHQWHEIRLRHDH